MKTIKTVEKAGSISVALTEGMSEKKTENDQNLSELQSTSWDDKLKVLY